MLKLNINRLSWLVRGKVFDLTNALRRPEGVMLDTDWMCTPYTDMYERYMVQQLRSGKVRLLYWTFSIGDVWSEVYNCGDFDTMDEAVYRIDEMRLAERLFFV